MAVPSGILPLINCAALQPRCFIVPWEGLSPKDQDAVTTQKRMSPVCVSILAAW
jgi:hypothetical protein